MFTFKVTYACYSVLFPVIYLQSAYIFLEYYLKNIIFNCNTSYCTILCRDLSFEILYNVSLFNSIDNFHCNYTYVFFLMCVLNLMSYTTLFNENYK